MPYPTLHDDGSVVTLDLHGATVDEAVRLARSAVDAAARRGRSQVKLIHGASTSDAGRRTIKHALRDLLDQGALSPHVVSDWRGDAFVTCALRLGSRTDAAPLRLLDL